MPEARAPTPWTCQATLSSADIQVAILAADTAADVDSPPSAGLPMRAAVTTLTQNILGAGVLALPYAFMSAGLAGGLLLFGVVIVLSTFTMGVLVLLANHLGATSYRGAAAGTLGGHWPMVVEVWVLCYSFGSCISYPILLGDFLHATAVSVGAGAWSSKTACMSGAVLLVCWPLSCAKSLGGLKWMSTIGLLSICFAVVAVVKRYADGTYSPPGGAGLTAFNMGTIGKCFPILVGSFGAHYNIPALYREVAPGVGSLEWGNTQEGRAAFHRMMRVILSALTLSSVAYGIVGVVVYATFGAGTHSDFTENFRPTDGWLVVVRLTMTCAICACFPLVMVSARNSAFNIALQPRGWAMTPRVRIALSTALTALCLAIAVAAGEVGIVLAYNGSVFGTPVCFIVPSMMYVCMPRQSQRPGLRAVCVASAVAGLIFSVVGVVQVSLTAAHSGSK